MHKWMRIITGTVIPSTMHIFAGSMGVQWSMADTRWAIATVFAAILAASIPDLNVFFKPIFAWLSKRATPAEKVALQDAQNTIAALEQKLLAQSQAQAKQNPFVNPPSNNGGGTNG